MYDTATILALFAGVILPHVTSILTGERSPVPSWAGGYVTLALSGAAGFLAEWQNSGDGYDWRKGALTAVVTFVIAALSRLVVHRDTNIEDKLLDLGTAQARRPKPGRHEDGAAA